MPGRSTPTISKTRKSPKKSAGTSQARQEIPEEVGGIENRGMVLSVSPQHFNEVEKAVHCQPGNWKLNLEKVKLEK